MPLIFKRGIAKPKKHHSKLDDLHARTQLYLRRTLGSADAQTVWMAGQHIHDLNERTLFYTQVVLRIETELLGEQASQDLVTFGQYRWQPVSFREFVVSPEYLNKEHEIYPAILAAGEELNNGTYVEAIMTGGIGSGKTTLALYTNAYQLYLLSCMRSPHKLFRLDPSSEILLVFQSITKTLAQGVDYQRFRSMIEGSPYFHRHFPFDKGLTSKLVFPNRVEVLPVAGTETAAIGQNVMGGLIDELNYMAVIEKSKVAVDKGTYDQAILVYNSIARRRKSRFMENGKLPGILCLVSSKKYPGQFTDQKMKEAETDPSIFVYDKRVWDIKPGDFGNRGWFHVFGGDMTRKPRILTNDEEVADEDRHLVVAVPMEFRSEFEKDIINALREIAGVSTLARHPFFLEVPKVHAAFKKEHISIFSQSPVDFVEQRLTLVKSAFHKPYLPRFCHIDLAQSQDSAGLCVGTCTGFQEVQKSGDQTLYMPQIWIDGILEIKPPKNSEIMFSKIREVLLVLLQMGLGIRWVTFDQFQSTDSKQILQQAGFMTGQQSMDELPTRPYDFTKNAVYEGRVDLPYHPLVQQEILRLERDQKTGKIDHPPGGSKDCADALAGVVYGLTMRREIWGLHKIPILMMPSGIRSAPEKMKEQKDQPNYQPEIVEEASHIHLSNKAVEQFRHVSRAFDA